MDDAERRYYAGHSAASDPADRAPLLAALPADPARLVTAVTGLVLHPLFVASLGISPPPESADDVESRSLPRMLDRLLGRDPAPLDVARPPARRFIGICRDYALLACAALRQHGVPARVRVGFAGYFTPGYLEDHWVCEYHAGERWRLLDPELGPAVRAHFGIGFDSADVPRDAFLVAGEAWQRARAGGLNPSTCGVSHIGVLGPGFIAASVLRDFAALNKREMLAWDVWGPALGVAPAAWPPADAAQRLDEIAMVTGGPAADWGRLRALYAGDERLRVPPVVTSFTSRGPAQVAVDGM
jgi:hypothetical protein